MRHLAAEGVARVKAFQFTHPVWGATLYTSIKRFNTEVSIHAPRVGCDPRWESSRREPRCFNTRTPCGVRLPHPHHRSSLNECFNSRTPCGVRRILASSSALVLEFQFTHPVWGATVHSCVSRAICSFQFTHPVWGATMLKISIIPSVGVSIHAPRVGCDVRSLATCDAVVLVSIHAPRVGCD